MKNSKFISILAAGAMVVSSLGLFGNVAYADNGQTLSFTSAPNVYSDDSLSTKASSVNGYLSKVYVNYDIKAGKNTIAVDGQLATGLSVAAEASNIINAEAGHPAMYDLDVDVIALATASPAKLGDEDEPLILAGTITPGAPTNPTDATTYADLTQTTKIYVKRPTDWLAETDFYIEDDTTATPDAVTPLEATLHKAIAAANGYTNATAAGQINLVAGAGNATIDVTTTADEGFVFKTGAAGQSGYSRKFTVQINDQALGTITVHVGKQPTPVKTEGEFSSIKVAAGSTDVLTDGVTVTEKADSKGFKEISVSFDASVDGTAQKFSKENVTITYDVGVWRDALENEVRTIPVACWEDGVDGDGLIAFKAGQGNYAKRITVKSGVVNEPVHATVTMEISAKSDASYWFTGKKTFVVTVNPRMTYTNITFTPSSRYVELESSSDGLRTITATLNTQNPADAYDESSLYWVWNIVNSDGWEMDRTSNDFLTFQGDDCVVPSLENATDVVEFDGKSKGLGLNSIRVGIKNAKTTGGCVIEAVAFFSQADYEAQNYDNARWSQFAVFVKSNETNLSVTLNKENIGENGVVTLSSKLQKFDNAVTVKGKSGADITKSVAYTAVRYDDFVVARQQGRTVEEIFTGQAGLARFNLVANGVMNVRSNFGKGAYTIIATDGVEYGAAEDAVVIRSAKGVKVSGVSLDYSEVTINNLNEQQTVYATIKDVVYLSNGYSKDEDKSAEILAVTVENKNPEIVSVALEALGGEGTAREYGTKPFVKNGVVVNNAFIANTRGIVVTSKKSGNATLVVKTVDGGYTAEINVKVTENGSDPTPAPGTEYKTGDNFVATEAAVAGCTFTVLTKDTVELTKADKNTTTIPAEITDANGVKMTIVAIDEKAFQGSSAKKIVIDAPIVEVGDKAWKGAKTKRITFNKADVLTIVGKKITKGGASKVKIVAGAGEFNKDVVKAFKTNKNVVVK